MVCNWFEIKKKNLNRTDLILKQKEVMTNVKVFRVQRSSLGAGLAQ
jgi:hypothetical protein